MHFSHKKSDIQIIALRYLPSFCIKHFMAMKYVCKSIKVYNKLPIKNKEKLTEFIKNV